MDKTLVSKHSEMGYYICELEFICYVFYCSMVHVGVRDSLISQLCLSVDLFFQRKE